MKSSPAPPTRETFRAAFCRAYRCEPEHFEKAVLARCFPWVVRLQGRLLLLLNPGIFQRELALIRRLGDVTDGSHLRQELEGYAYELQRDKTFRTSTLGIRLSRRRVVKLLREVTSSNPGGSLDPGMAPASTATPQAEV